MQEGKGCIKNCFIVKLYNKLLVINNVAFEVNSVASVNCTFLLPTAHTFSPSFLPSFCLDPSIAKFSNCSWKWPSTSFTIFSSSGGGAVGKDSTIFWIYSETWSSALNHAQNQFYNIVKYMTLSLV